MRKIPGNRSFICNSFALIGLLLLVYSCSQVKSVSRKDVSGSYSGTVSFFDLKGDLHIDRLNNEIDLFVSFNNEAIKYELNDVGQSYLANYTIEFESYSSYEEADIKLRRIWNFEDSTHFGRNVDLEWMFSIDTCDNESKLFVIRLTDNHLKKSEELFLYKEYSLSNSDFMLLDLAQDPIYDNIVFPNQKVVLYNKDINRDFNVVWYEDSYKAAAAPYISAELESLKYDSIFPLERINDSILTFTTKYNAGSYYIVNENDQIQFDIHTLNMLSGQHLNIQLLKEPLKYISTGKEYRRIIDEQLDPLYAIERFWLDLCNDNDAMAQNLSDIYYNNVETANLLFSSYKSGWKTDRGMIYIVMGKPSRVFVSDDYEEWTYGDLNDFRSISLVFKKEEITPGIYDYVLERNPVLKHDWYLHAEKWRK